MRKLAGFLLLLGFTTAHATSVVVDFNELTPAFQISTFDSAGFRFTAGTSDFVIGSNFGPGPSPAVAISGVDSTMELIGAGTFSLQNFKMRTFSGLSENVVITGYFGAGGQISKTITAIDSYAPTYRFTDDWQGLTSIQFDTSGGSPVYLENVYTDVIVSTVPIPAAAWLFGSALAGLGWMRRKSVHS